MTTHDHESTAMTRELLIQLSAAQEPPCLSLYQPTHRRHPDNRQDPIRFRNLLKELEVSLLREYAPEEVEVGATVRMPPRWPR